MKQDRTTYELALSINEITILMGCVSTYAYVPFVLVEKPLIEQEELVELQRLHDILLAKRNQYLMSGDVVILIKNTDCSTLLRILRLCQQEYNESILDQKIHLNISSEGELEKIISKLQTN